MITNRGAEIRIPILGLLGNIFKSEKKGTNWEAEIRIPTLYLQGITLKVKK